MTTVEAIDIIFGVLYDVWNHDNYIQWPHLVGSKPVPAEDLTEKTWARVALKHDNSFLSSLADETGKKIYTSNGFLVVTVFVPFATGTNGYELAEQIRNAYRDSRTAVLLRNARIKEGGNDGSFTVYMVIVDFEYDEVR